MWLPLWLVLPALLSATGWQAWPALEAALGSVQATKEIVIKRLLPLPCTTLLHYPSLPWDASRSRVAAHCPTVNNALGSLVSGGVVAAREARSAILAKNTLSLTQKKFRPGNLQRLGNPRWIERIKILSWVFCFRRMLIGCSSLSC